MKITKNDKRTDHNQNKAENQKRITKITEITKKYRNHKNKSKDKRIKKKS